MGKWTQAVQTCSRVDCMLQTLHLEVVHDLIIKAILFSP